MTPAMLPRLRSRGVATVAAITSGLAPGKLADTEMVGKSTWGRGAMGNSRKPSKPDNNSASINKLVATGRRMKGRDRFMGGF